MSLIEHARRELKVSGLSDKDSDYNGMISEAVIELIEVFSKQDHSGTSADITISVFNDLARYKPIHPLTGEDSEWNNISESMGGNVTHQNNRCSRVFKDANGCYDIEGIVWKDWYGPGRFTNGRSHVPVKFPYSPKTVYKTCWPWTRAWWSISHLFSK